MTMRHIEGRGGLRPFLEDPDKAKAGLAKLLIQGARTWRQLYGDLELPTSPLGIGQPNTQAKQARERKPRPQDILRQAVRELKKGVSTPEAWTSYWRAKFQADGRRIGVNLEVPDCNWTEEEIRRPMVDISGKEIPSLMVPVISGITLPILGRMYPAMQNRTVREDSPVIDTHVTEGWVKVYAAVDAPNTNTDLADAEKFAEKNGYLPGREKTYILGAQALKDLEGEYFDQGQTWSWLPGSRIDGKLVSAIFNPVGKLSAFWDLYPDCPYRYYGWRFEEVKK